MVTFVHLTPEKNVDTILRNGITHLRKQNDHPRGIFAMPTGRSFHISHQWIGELRERGHLQVAGLYFRVPDSEIVWVGHYRLSHQRMIAAEAVSLFVREKRPGLRSGHSEEDHPRRDLSHPPSGERSGMATSPLAATQNGGSR